MSLILIMILLIVIIFSLYSISSNLYKNSVWKEENTLQEDLLNLQQSEGCFSTYVNNNPLYKTYYSLLALKNIENEMALIASDMTITKSWLRNMEIDDVIKDSTPIADIYYFCRSTELLGMDITDEMESNIKKKLQELYKIDGFFTYETKDATVFQNGLRDAANRSMTFLAIETLEMMSNSEIYNKEIIYQNVKETISFYIEEIMNDGIVDVVRLSNIKTLVEIAQSLGYEVLDEKMEEKNELGRYVMEWQSGIKKQKCDELMTYYHLSTYLGLAEKLELEIDRKWVISTIEQLLLSQDIYIVAHTLEIAQQHDFHIKVNELVNIKDNILLNMHYEGSLDFAKQKNIQYSDIENTYYAYQLLIKEGWQSNKKLVDFLKNVEKKQDNLGCTEKIFLLDLLYEEQLVKDGLENWISIIVKEIEQMTLASQMIEYYKLLDFMKKIDMSNIEMEENIHRLLSLDLNEISSNVSMQRLISTYQVLLYSQYQSGWDEKTYLEKKANFINFFNEEVSNFSANSMFFYYLLNAASDLGWISEINVNDLEKQIQLFDIKRKIRNLYVDDNSYISLQTTYYMLKMKELL